jgi:YidC/Oxa1 family membrane protein insertase
MLSFLTTPLFQLLVGLNSYTGNFGVSIVLITLLARFVFLPLTYPSLKTQFKNRKAMKALAPKLAELKKKHKGDNVKFAQAQSELFKEHNIKLTAGLLPNILQIVFLIAFFQVLQRFLQPDVSISQESLFFLGSSMIEPDKTFIMPILTGVTQFIFSLMLLPGLEQHDLIPNNAKDKKTQEANKAETNQQDMAMAMQQQMLFIMPVMTGFIALRFPAGLSLYWIVSTLFSIAQQYTVSGWGGIEKYAHQIQQKFLLKK